MTNYDDKDLFNACMNFCQVFTMFLIKKQEIENNRFIDEYEKRERLKYYKSMMMSKFDHLEDVVSSIKGDLE